MDSKTRKCSCVLVTAVLLLVLGVILVAFGLSSLALFPYIIDNQIKNNLELKNGSSSTKTWESPPVPVYMQFWFWNCTNPDQFIKGKDKPNMEQIGPFTYKEIRDKTNVSFNNNGTIFFREHKSYVFQPELSAKNINTTVTVVNLPMLTVLAKIQNRLQRSDVQFFVKELLEIFGINLFETHTIQEFFWGYKIKIIERLIKDIEGSIFRNLLKDFVKELKSIETFGIFYIGKPLNGTDDGNYEIYSGTKKINRIGEYVSFNYNKYLPYWNNKYCNMLNGSDGSFYPPGLKKSSHPCVFTGDLGRSICLEFERDVTFKGIDLYRFAAPEFVLGNVTVNPDNYCFCTPHCLDTGVLNISRVRNGAPLVVSQPHFFQAASKYIHGVNGMHPNVKEHQTFLEIEPNTGVSLNVAKKLQINAYLTKIGKKGILQTENINTPVIFPLFWLNESASANTKAVNLMKDEAITPIRLLGIARWFCLGLGAFFILVSCFIFLSLYLKKEKKSHYIDDRQTLIEDNADSTSNILT